jgi:hypothetical protein
VFDKADDQLTRHALRGAFVALPTIGLCDCEKVPYELCLLAALRLAVPPNIQAFIV